MLPNPLPIAQQFLQMQWPIPARIGEPDADEPDEPDPHGYANRNFYRFIAK